MLWSTVRKGGKGGDLPAVIMVSNLQFCYGLMMALFMSRNYELPVERVSDDLLGQIVETE
jgi:hypothetical protein